MMLGIVFADMKRSNVLWLIALGACVLAGVLMEIAYPRPPLPRHLGFYLASAAFVSGLNSGLAGVLLPVAAIAAFGLARQIQANGEQSDIIIGSFWYILPVIYGAVALVGAAVSQLWRHFGPH